MSSSSIEIVRLEAFVLTAAFASVRRSHLAPGRSVQFEFARFLRPEQKFATAAALQRQIRRDAARARSLLGVR